MKKFFFFRKQKLNFNHQMKVGNVFLIFLANKTLQVLPQLKLLKVVEWHEISFYKFLYKFTRYFFRTEIMSKDFAEVAWKVSRHWFLSYNFKPPNHIFKVYIQLTFSSSSPLFIQQEASAKFSIILKHLFEVCYVYYQNICHQLFLLVLSLLGRN